VLDGKSNITNNASYYSINPFGDFTIKKFDTPYTNYKVWVSVFNSFIWGDGAGAAGYLIDVTIVETDVYVPPFTPEFTTEL
jgi:hypothetical protein